MWPFKKKIKKEDKLLLDVKKEINNFESSCYAFMANLSSELHDELLQRLKMLEENVLEKQKKDINDLECKLKNFFGILEYEKTPSTKQLLVHNGLLSNICTRLKETETVFRRLEKYDKN